MTYVHIDVHHLTHTCPADPEPHPYDTRRTVVATVPGGPCRHPATVRSGDTVALVACHRARPRPEQCPACLVTIVERSVTFTYMGHVGPQLPHDGTAA